MEIGRREFFLAGAAVIGVDALAVPGEAKPMYGLIVNMTAIAGRRDDLIASLIAAVGNMPGCLSYIVARDLEDENKIWVTEAWDSKASHDASLTLPAVTKSIAAVKPLLAAFGSKVVTTPVGGYGLPTGK